MSSSKFPRTSTLPSTSSSSPASSSHAHHNNHKSHRSLYSPASLHSRSRSHLPSPKPKVLPFPDIPVRPISTESSRAATPLPSPAPTRRSSSQDAGQLHLNVGGVSMATSRSSDSNSNDRPSLAGGSSTSSIPQIPMSHSRSTSPTMRSPLAASSSSPSIAIRPGPSRSRAQTNPYPNVEDIGSPIRRNIHITPILNNPTRTQGFYPVSVPPSPLATSPLISPTSIAAGTRSTSLPGASTLPPLMERPKPPQPVKKLSNPPQPPPQSVQITRDPAPSLLGDHMYQAFLKGTCADVRLFVRKWGVAWKVHKMVLVQAGFFHSLFLGGFSEQEGLSLPSRKGKEKANIDRDDWRGEQFELIFDDPNITRAAFEICLSRLYSSFPQLHFPSSLLPTPSDPLTASPHPTGSNPYPSLLSIHEATSKNQQLATPRLLLSLLATTIYLGHGSLLREALSMVLRTVGPTTIGRYLAFATGGGIGEEEWPAQNDEGAKGLEDLAHPLHSARPVAEESIALSPEIASEMPTSQLSSTNLSDDGNKVGEHWTESPSDRSTPTIKNVLNLGDAISESASFDATGLPHFYGFASNKIGEACMCWLTRWGVDLLNIEAAVPESNEDVRIWSHRGLPANFLGAVLSADSFFAENEMERYRIARRVLDLRRKGWEEEMEGKGDISSIQESIISEDSGWEEWEEDEAELAKVFAEGIYYTHMNFDDLSTIASDVDPTTSLPYVPLSVLQAAHWSAADLRNRVLSPSSIDSAELVLTTTASDLALAHQKRRRITPRSRVPSSALSSASMNSDHHSGAHELYHLLPTDDTHRIGAGGLLYLTAQNSALPVPGIPGLPDLGPEVDKSYSVEGARPAKFRPPPQGEKTAFGLLRETASKADLIEQHSRIPKIISTDTEAEAPPRWTKHDPYRFAVEFWGVDKLVEKERAYSTTHFYAGSWFNVYVQTIRKKEKGTQLGIYLHRQNPNEVFPVPSLPSRKASAESTDSGELASRGRAMSSPPITAAPLTSIVPGLGSPGAIEVEEREVRVDDGAHYKDPRKVTRAYFSISCASALGTALIRFSSGPDNFALSQSWGWKSSALRSEEYLTSDSEGEEGVLGWVGEVEGANLSGSLRATVVLGVV